MLKLNLQLFAESTDPDEESPQEGGLTEWQQKMEQQISSLQEALTKQPEVSESGAQKIPAPETPEEPQDEQEDEPPAPKESKSSRLGNFLNWIL